MEVSQRANYHGLFVGWHNIKFFAVLPAKRLSYYAPVSVFWNEIKSSKLLCVRSLPWLGWRTTAVSCLVKMITIHRAFTEW